MKKFISIFLLILSLNASSKERLIITGSSTIAPVIADLAKLYEYQHKGIRIDVQTGGSSRGILDARKGISQIGMVSRSLNGKESDLHNFTFAKDGIAIIVHKSNKLNKVTIKQLRDIYLGQVKNWKDIGGDDKQIVVVNKAAGRSTLELFLKYLNIKNSEVSASIIIGDNEQGVKTISRNPNAIGYVSVGTAEYNVSAGVGLKLLSIDGVVASVGNVKKGLYPITRELNLVTKVKPSGELKKFIQFVLSHKSFETIREHYFVPIDAS